MGILQRELPVKGDATGHSMRRSLRRADPSTLLRSGGVRPYTSSLSRLQLRC
jgi:hypothetical protein